MDDVDIHLTECAGIKMPRFRQFLQHIDGPQLEQKGRIETDLIHSVLNVSCRFRRTRSHDRIDLYDDRVVRLFTVKEREQGRIADKSAIPVRRPVNFNGLEHIG